MPTTAQWTDLLDPDEDAVRQAWPNGLHATAVTSLLEPAAHEDEPRPRLEAHGDYVFGSLLVPVAVPDEDRVYYQEVVLLLTEKHVLTVRKTPQGGKPLDLSGVHE